tara:strand:- start:1688 stop:2086 length:399 start_codon:yes stop_codon:yes gene_type:complete
MVPIKIEVSRVHLSGCKSYNMKTNVVNTKHCIDCTNYPLRDTSDPCLVKYKLKGLDRELRNIVVEFCNEDEPTGETLYRLFNTLWKNFEDIVLIIGSTKKGALEVSRSPRNPSEEQSKKAKAIANQNKEKPA